MKYFLINAFGKDRPGIVKDVSKVSMNLVLILKIQQCQGLVESLQ
ncbi:hypothetical protein HG1285_05103 [Hydrogenivirga sp. 128-5-R1-1]|nr:hypothetical protein HG1285_05103 [Hydrogenivirga sp. 128-5-R1-1]